MNYCVECQPQQKSCETCKFWENINCPDCINDSGEMDCYTRGESCHNCGRVFERRDTMYDISVKIGEICNKPQEYADMVNELLVLFKDCEERQKRKAKDEINRLKEQHAEEISEMKAQKQEYVNETEKTIANIRTQYAETTEEHISLLKTVEIEKNHLESQYLGYRQAVKDILGGEG